MEHRIILELLGNEYCAGMGATFPSLRLEISLEVGGAGNIVINVGVLEKVRNFYDIPNL